MCLGKSSHPSLLSRQVKTVIFMYKITITTGLVRDPDEALEKALARLQLSVQKKLGSGAEKSKKSKKGK